MKSESRRWAIDNLHDVEMDGRLIVVRAEQSMEQRGTTPDEFQQGGSNDNVYDRMPDEGGPPRKEFHDQWQNTKVFVSQLRCGHPPGCLSVCVGVRSPSGELY